MELEDVSYSLENEQQFWVELEKILSEKCDSHARIDNALRAYLGFSAQFKDEYLVNEYDISRCSYKLFSSSLFAQHADYIRRQIIYSLLEEDEPDILQFIVSFLLFDGRQNDSTFLLMNEVGTFPRLLKLVHSIKLQDGDGADLHRMLMDLLYEMSRIQRIKIEDLVLVEDSFIRYLFDLIEGLSDDAHDPYHYPVIRVLLVLNEQFMVLAHDPASGTPSNPLTNKVMKILSVDGNNFKTFGENIILLLNREGETSLQLLTLKLLYLIFTTPSTYEYFYTNDLRVLVDILIRNLLDLPAEAVALRHTYLRVLYPLLAHTQLKDPPHYKRDEIRKTLSILVHSRIEGNEHDYEKIMHFGEADDTTKRLVSRCSQVEWLHDPEPELCDTPDIPEEDGQAEVTGVPIPDVSHEKGADLAESPVSQSSDSTTSPTELAPPSPNTSFSVIAPDITTKTGSDAKVKSKPPPPKSRRSGHHVTEEHDDNRGRSAVLREHHAPTLTVSHESPSGTLPLPKPPSTSRSTSRPAPAVPPPRRSTHHASPNATTSDHHTYHHIHQNTYPPLPIKSNHKPPPPKTRRWQHGAKLSHELSGADDERSASPASVGSFAPPTDSDDSHPVHDSSVAIEQTMEKTSLEA
ncbi:conserved hypothetical protein [Talaromyces stipitatus ATCC 10500]|uniref:SPIN90/Ldb17 leucine-rich domain-containing protein n=1 Tax=Talaromyces stipitatus (strain ATCC 10500 / CBS 375.48 / QM 6759 / NRRL 1006) TaxID=441959 RepID=B8MDC6_TALSN|nr:uncharacterized protein TSTA_114600 [Talaromyces stipitatus ATCC 10500]EED17651.1 conserved hypothetical protein [Talaromyces stipitatus ATCC 10500]